jgi:predicted RNA-binding Zn ribbon-like protein
VADFNFFGGNLALDFTGTLGRRRTEPVEMLAGLPDLGRWLDQTGLRGTGATVGADDFALALRLREAIWRLVQAAMAGEPFDQADRAVVNQAAAVAPPVPRITEDGTLRHSGEATASLSLVARSAVELLTSGAAARVHECEGDRCNRLFLDASGRGSRRWCSMRRCGNRAKVAGYRSRQVTD